MSVYIRRVEHILQNIETVWVCIVVKHKYKQIDTHPPCLLFLHYHHYYFRSSKKTLKRKHWMAVTPSNWITITTQCMRKATSSGRTCGLLLFFSHLPVSIYRHHHYCSNSFYWWLEIIWVAHSVKVLLPC